MKRVSKAGAEFNRDVSQPALGEAYRDPSGLIWGNIINRMNQYDADKYCKAVGARLPTKSEFEQLAKYLGYRTSGGYNPYLADGRSDVLPGLSQYVFWSSSEGNNSPVQFEGQDGSDRGARLEELASVRCVQNSNKTSNSKN